MADIVVNGNTSGAVTLSAPAVAGTVTVTLPASSGTMAVLPTATGVLTEAAGGTGTTTGYYGFKSRIINGGMTIDQRNAGASSTTPTVGTGVYTIDRFAYVVSQASKFTIQQTPSTTETGFATRVAAGFSNYLACTVGASANVTIGASDYFQIYQNIEGFNTADLAWGTANAKTVTLSFLVYSSVTGTFGGALRNGSFNRSYPFTYSIPTANTWTSISITIAGDTSGTWSTTNGIGIIVGFSLGSSASGSATAGAWIAGNYGSATGAVSPITTNSATFYITGVQLEKGSTATSFDYRPYTTELQLCQRYYWKTFPQATKPAQNTAVYAGAINYVAVLAGANYMSAPVFFPVVMRDTPTTITFYNPGAANAKWRNGSLGSDSGNAATNSGASQNGFLAINNPQVAGDGINNTIYIHATAEAEL